MELAKGGMLAKFQRRDGRWGAAPAFLLTWVEAILALLFVRLAFRLLMKVVGLVGSRRAAKPA